MSGAKATIMMGLTHVVDDTNDTSLAGASFRTPGKITRVKTEGAMLMVSAASADNMNSLWADTSIGGLSGSLESALLPCRQKVRTYVQGSGAETSSPYSRPRTIRAFDIC